MLAVAAGLLVVAQGAAPVGAAPPSPAAPAANGQASPAAGGRADDAALELFEKEVRPLLARRCYQCHSAAAKKPKGGLRVDSRAALLAGGDTGPAIVPGQAKESLLVDAINYGEQYQMPPTKKLPADEIAVLTRWVELGAPWPTASNVPTATSPGKTFDLASRRAAHWAWQPPAPQSVPRVADADWPRTPIDHFILARLEAANLRPAPAADRRTLIRRLYFDLVGLPPTPEDVEAFVADRSPKAIERLVDRLLDSPHFGERWARHWLDLVRYAETRGHEFEPLIPNAWQYRDYVIRALNRDVPYDQFVREHIAGDLVEQPRLNPDQGFNESILGTGFWFLGEEVHSPVDIRQDECDRMDNRLDVLTKTFLGLTVSCARCHDHKFDAISQRDYYALGGYLISSGYRQVRFQSLEHNRQIAGQLDALRTSARITLLALTAQAERETLEHLTDYLLAARELTLTGAKAASAGTAQENKENIVAELKGEQQSAALAAAADTRQLDTKLLAAWMSELEKAAAQPAHPLHPYAVVARDEAVDDPQRLAERLAAVRQRIESAQSAGQAIERIEVNPADVVVDYRRGATAPWYQDGFAFGPRPVRPGDVHFGSRAEQPIPGMIDYGAAERDPWWNVLKTAPGTERDEARLGTWDRPGRTLRTPETTLHSPRLWYLVKGSGRAYAAVNSHLIIRGPLHGELLMEFKGKPDQWQWVAHNLAAYQGHRFHVEFTPRDEGALAVALVVASEAQPPLPARGPNRLIEQIVASESVDSMTALAKAYQRALLAVSQRMETGELAGDADGTPAGDDAGLDRVRLADWLLAHVDLFSAADSPARIALREAGAKFIAAQQALQKQVRAQSQTAPAMLDGNGIDELLLVRGNSHTPAEPVGRRFLEALGGRHIDEPGSGRMGLARAVADADNPLTARVMVNRIWHHLFGRGIVASVDNFGVLGERPSHPELLDYLARQFVADGWSIKRMVRLMVLSSTYQMASTLKGPGEQIDPDNILLHRMPIRRLEGEVIRDALLAVSGRLDRTPFGPSVPVHLTAFLDGRGRPGSGPLDGNGRRSVYISVRRNFLSPMMLAFDTPQPFSTMGRRNVSNVPAQALILMNDPLVIQLAQRWAKQVLADKAHTPEERITRMYEAALSRTPSQTELDSALAFLDKQAKRYGLSGPQRLESSEPWADLCHVLFNVKEFIFLN